MFYVHTDEDSKIWEKKKNIDNKSIELPVAKWVVFIKLKENTDKTTEHTSNK